MEVQKQKCHGLCLTAWANSFTVLLSRKQLDINVLEIHMFINVLDLLIIN